MRRVAYPPRRRFVAVAVGWLLLAALPFLPAPPSSPLGILLLALLAALVLWATLALAFERTVVEGGVLTMRSLRRRERLRVPLDEIARYAPDALGRWWVQTSDGRRARVPVADPWALHAALAEGAPRALAAKRLRPLHLPPTEEFHGLWTYDVEGLLQETLARGLVLVAVVALTRRPGAAVGLLVAPLFFGLFDMAGRLDVTDRGLVRRGPFGRREILWADAVAVFCEPPLARRRFVVTSSETAIEIPVHLARELDPMRKLFRSLPEGTLLVNFDESTFRGYRRRRKAEERAPARNEDLLPALTAATSPGRPAGPG